MTLGRKYESGSQKSKRKEKSERKPKDIESKCKKTNYFFPNKNEQLADPTSIPSLSYDNQDVETMNLESTAEQLALAFLCCNLCVVDCVFCVVFIYPSSMKQCKNFILCSTFYQNMLPFLINQNNKLDSTSLI